MYFRTILIIVLISSLINGCSIIYPPYGYKPFRSEKIIVLPGTLSGELVEFENEKVLLKFSKSEVQRESEQKRQKKYSATNSVYKQVYDYLDTLENPINIKYDESNCLTLDNTNHLNCLIQTLIIPNFLNEGKILVFDKRDLKQILEINQIEERDENGHHTVGYYFINDSEPFYAVSISQYE